MAKKTTTTTKKTKDKSENKTDESQSKILKNLAQRLSDDYHPNHNYSDISKGSKNDPEIQKINRMIQKSANKISSKKDSKSIDEKKSKPPFSPSNFDGVSDPKEERTLLIEKIKHLERQNLKQKHELELLHEDFQKEKTHLKKTVRDLKGEIHRTAPLTDSKIFSFSKELRHVAQTVQSLSDEQKNMFSIESSDRSEPETLSPPQVSIEDPTQSNKISDNPLPKEIKKASSNNTQESPKELSRKSPKEKNTPIKLTKKQKIAGGATVGILLGFLSLGAILSSNNKVDDQIVDTYLEERNQGQVQGATNTSPTPHKKPDQRNNQITFEEADWEIFRDEFLGFQLEYPSNAVDLLHTGNTITFLRYDGYLYKMQRIQSDETPSEYIDRTEVNGLQYSQEDKLLYAQEALHLNLEEDIEFPGNRYIVQKQGYIFDIWYATQSANFNQEDMRFVNKMIETTRFP